MIAYLLKSVTCLALLIAFYHIVLEREKMYNFNRFYLLGSVLFSFLAPLYVIYTQVKPILIESILTTTTNFQSENITHGIIVKDTVDYLSIFIIIYFIISSILLIRFGRNLFNIINKTKNQINLHYKNAILVLVDDKILPHTFWNYIFINRQDYQNKRIEKELFTHELTHVSQKHTLDILILEFIHSLFWINPFFILLKKTVQLNHEFLADEKVIKEHKNTFQYQHLLLNKVAWKNKYYLASNLNYSLTKKRLKMMTAQSSPTKILLKKLAIIPLLTGFVFLFAKRVEAQEIIEVIEEVKTKEKIEVIDEQVFTSKGEKVKTGFNLINNKNYYFVTYGNTTKFYNKNGQIVNKYGEIISSKIANASEIIPGNYVRKTYFDGKVFCEFKDDIPNSNIVNEELLNQLKKGEEKIKNSILKEYNKLAKRHNQKPIEKRIIKLKDYNKLEALYKQLSKEEKRNAEPFPNFPPPPKIGIVYNYKYLYNKYETKRNDKPHFVKSSDKRQKELKELFTKLGSMYFKLSKENKKKVKRPIHPHDPYLRLMKNNKVFYKLRSELTKEDELLIPPPPPMPNATKEQILKAEKAYKNWKKRTGNSFKSIPPPPPPRHHLDQVIEMAKKGAKFYFEGESIDSDKAIKLLKNNKKLSIHSENTNNSNYKVWISKKSIDK